MAIEAMQNVFSPLATSLARYAQQMHGRSLARPPAGLAPLPAPAHHAARGAGWAAGSERAASAPERAGATVTTK